MGESLTLTHRMGKIIRSIDENHTRPKRNECTRSKLMFCILTVNIGCEIRERVFTTGAAAVKSYIR